MVVWNAGGAGFGVKSLFLVGSGSNAMEVQFVTDKAGAVTKVVRQGSYELRAVRKR